MKPASQLRLGVTRRSRFWWVTFGVAALAAGYPLLVAVSLTAKFIGLSPQGGDNVALVPLAYLGMIFFALAAAVAVFATVVGIAALGRAVVKASRVKTSSRHAE